MSDVWNEDERVAAFLDGRLDERQRAEMLARLATDDEAYEHFAATAAILRAVGETEGADAGARADEHDDIMLAGSRPTGAPAPPIALSADTAEPSVDHGVTRRHPGKVATVVRWLALAAAVAGLALVGRSLWPRPSSVGDPMRLAARLEHVDQGLPAAWNQPPPWISPRGDGDSDLLSAEEKAAEAARAGALLVDLSVAVRGRDAARTRVLANQITSRFDPRGGRNGALRSFEQGAGGPPERLEPLVAQATDRIVGRLEREALELGAWTEAARLAAARHDADFFRDRQTRPTLNRLELRVAADPPAHAAAERVRLLLTQSDPPQWDALVEALRSLAREIASG